MQPFKFYLVTDTHYFDRSFSDGGEAYKEYMLTEQKCSAETAAINEAVFKVLAESEEADTVIIPGDLSFNGEKLSHESFIKLLAGLKEAGKKIYVITAGHDFKEHPFAFRGAERYEPENVKRADLFDMYYEYGFKDAIAVDRESLSYVAQLADGIRLLALNNDGDCKNYTYTARQIEWILQQTKKGREDGQLMIVINHFPLLPANPVFELVGDAVMKNWDAVTTMLADEGVHLCLTGHMHNQSIKFKDTEKGSRIWDVCTSSLIGYPALYRLITITDGHHADIKSIPVPKFDWDMEGLTNDEYFARQFDMMINTYLDFMENDPARLLRKFGVKEAPEILKKIIPVIGKTLNKATLGGIGKKMLFKCDPAIKDVLFRDYAKRLVRGIFAGNASYVEGTPEYDFMMKLLGRFRPVLAIVGKKTGRNVFDLVKYTMGHYGVDENNTVIEW